LTRFPLFIVNKRKLKKNYKIKKLVSKMSLRLQMVYYSSTTIPVHTNNAIRFNIVTSFKMCCLHLKNNTNDSKVILVKVLIFCFGKDVTIYYRSQRNTC
jgi:hypothetical protein